MKIGIIGRADRTGLGIETEEFIRHFPDSKALIVKIPDKDAKNGSYYGLNLLPFADYTLSDIPPTEDTIRRFLKGVDILFTIETPYNPDTYRIARELGVKSVLRVNFEWLNAYKDQPDLYLAPSLWRFNEYPEPKEYLPYPIATDRLPFRLRKKAITFVHLAGNMKAVYDRNGTEAFMRAIKLVKSQEARFIIKSQVPLPEMTDPRVKVICEDKANYWENWTGEGDVLVLPRRYAGQSLPLNEAMACGLAVIATDMTPQSEFLPKKLLIPVRSFQEVPAKNLVRCADLNPQDIADKIDEIAGKDISEYSKISHHIAQQWSWDNLLPKYQQIFNKLYADK